MSNAMRVFYVKASGLVVAYGTMDWENGADWDPAIHAFVAAPPDLPSSEPITLGPGPAPLFNWRYDSDTGRVVDA